MFKVYPFSLFAPSPQHTISLHLVVLMLCIYSFAHPVLHGDLAEFKVTRTRRCNEWRGGEERIKLLTFQQDSRLFSGSTLSSIISEEDEIRARRQRHFTYHTNVQGIKAHSSSSFIISNQRAVMPHQILPDPQKSKPITSQLG